MHVKSVVALFILGATALSLIGNGFAEETMKVAVVTGGHSYEKKPFEEMFKNFEGLECVFLELEDQGGVFDDISQWPYKAVVLYN
ncbi:MAG TPA: hypothetical protein PLC40_20095, partial [Candidatus Hydrogenedentes bacterium]|nr:hypothetical protein [Candidatus Hydrogenedentota bacterium]